MSVVDTILKYSVNTWDQGFLDKLYASTNAVSTCQSNRKDVFKADISSRSDSSANCFSQLSTQTYHIP
jgi:hypothetical protein